MFASVNVLQKRIVHCLKKKLAIIHQMWKVYFVKVKKFGQSIPENLFRAQYLANARNQPFE